MFKPYDPVLKRSNALEEGKKAFSLLQNKDFRQSLESFKRSNEILKEFLDDAKDMKNFDFREIAPEYDHAFVIKDIADNCIRDLAINYENMAKAYYFLDDYDKCSEYLKKSIDSFGRFNALTKTAQSFNNVAHSYFTAFLFSMYMNKDSDEYKYLIDYIKRMLNIFVEHINYPENYIQDFDFALEILEKYLKSDTGRAKEITILFTNAVNALMKNECYSEYLLFQNFAINILNFYIDNNEDWKVKRESFETILISYLFNCLLIVEQYNYEEGITFSLELLESIGSRFKEAKSANYVVDALSRLVVRDFDKNDYDKAAEHLLEIINIIEQFEDQFTDLDKIIRYEKLIPAFTESKQLDKVEPYFKKTSELLDEISWHPEYEDKYQVTEKEFLQDMQMKRVELNFNMGINRAYREDIEGAEKYFSKAKILLEEAKELLDKEYIDSVNNRIELIKNNFSKSDENLFNETQKIREYSDRIENTLDSVFGTETDIDSEEAHQKGIEAAKLLLELEKLPMAVEIVNPSRLLKYYYFTTILLNHPEDISLSLSLLDHIPKFIDYNNLAFPEYLAILLSDYSSMIDDYKKAKYYLSVAISILEDMEATDNFNPLAYLPNIYYNYAVINLKDNNFKVAKEFAQKAEDLWKLSQREGLGDFTGFIQTCNDLIKWCDRNLS